MSNPMNLPGMMKARRRRSMIGGDGEDLPQGQEYLEMHPAMRRQAGGAYTPLGGAPVVPGDQGLLEGGLREQARVDSIDASIAATKGMSDQSGGRRRRSRKNGASARRSRKNGASARRSRKNGASARRSRKNGASARRRRNNGASARRRRNNGNGNVGYYNNSAPAYRRRRSRSRSRRNNGNGNGNVGYYNNSAPAYRRSRRSKMRGGAASYAGAPYGQSSMLLQGSEAAKAGTSDFSDPFARGSA